MQTTAQRDRDTDGETEIQTDRNISSTGNHWGPTYPSIGINALRRWTPTLVIVIIIVIISLVLKLLNKITKIKKGPRTTGRTDGHIILPLGVFGPVALHALRKITCRMNDLQKVTQKTGQRYRETDGRTYKLDWTTLGIKGCQLFRNCMHNVNK